MNTALYLSARRSSARTSPRANRPAPPVRYSKRAVARADHDFYPTPPEAVHALLSVESFDGPVWEPACGNGAISRELERSGHTVVSTDLIDRNYGQGGCDFLCPISFTRIMLENPKLKHIVTNPPYSYKPGIGDKFVGQALKFARMHGGKVAMLLNLGCLAHPSRTPKWQNDPPTTIYVLDDLTCLPYGERRHAGKYITEHRYCWVVWHYERATTTKMSWVATAPFRNQGGRA